MASVADSIAPYPDIYNEQGGFPTSSLNSDSEWGYIIDNSDTGSPSRSEFTETTTNHNSIPTGNKRYDFEYFNPQKQDQKTGKKPKRKFSKEEAAAIARSKGHVCPRHKKSKTKVCLSL
jgi:hypothetical protein